MNAKISVKMFVVTGFLVCILAIYEIVRVWNGPSYSDCGACTYSNVIDRCVTLMSALKKVVFVDIEI